MGGIVGLLIDRTQQRRVRLGLAAVVFLLALGLFTFVAALAVQDGLKTEAQSTLAGYAKLRGQVVEAFTALQRDVTAAPCTPAFALQLRQVAFLPDGLSEFLYAPGGLVQCSVTKSSISPAYDLGAPDLAAPEPGGAAFWFDRDLGFVDLPGLSGTITIIGNFGVVTPRLAVEVGPNPWVSREIVIRAADGKWWHRAGDKGPYLRSLDAEATPGGLAWLGDRFSYLECDPAGAHCIVTEATLAGIVNVRRTALVGGILLTLLVAWWLSGTLHAGLRRHWSFEARFARHFGPARLQCTYQPILDLRTNRISSCEVLVRWRDLDERLVFPDQFLPVVEKRGLTIELTRHVVGKALRELSERLDPDRRIQVNFNVFPRDLARNDLVAMLAPLVAAYPQFDIVIEIVESDAVSFETATQQIGLLRSIGVGVYLDDFGTGFSNIRHLALLPLDGVKLDREFAMAPDESLMGQMLPGALDMVRRAGRIIVVEGVETSDRLAMLRLLEHVDYVQGYHIARPLDIERFARFLAERDVEQRKPRLVA